MPRGIRGHKWHSPAGARHSELHPSAHQVFSPTTSSSSPWRSPRPHLVHVRQFGHCQFVRSRSAVSSTPCRYQDGQREAVTRLPPQNNQHQTEGVEHFSAVRTHQHVVHGACHRMPLATTHTTEEEGTPDEAQMTHTSTSLKFSSRRDTSSCITSVSGANTQAEQEHGQPDSGAPQTSTATPAVGGA